MPPREELPGADTAEVRCGWGMGRQAGTAGGWGAPVPLTTPQLPRKFILVSATPPHPPRIALHTLQFGGLDGYVELMQRCWAADAAERPSSAEVAQELR